MEPLSALSIAAAGVQFVDFAVQLLKNAAEAYKSTSGHMESLGNLEQLTSDLDSLTSRINEKRSQLGSPQPGTPDAMLLEACQQCQEVSQELSVLLQTLRATHVSKRKIKSALSSLTAAVRAAMSDSRIKDLTEKLRTAQRQMHMAALLSLWEKAQEHGETLEQASKNQAEMVATLGQLDAATKDTASFLKTLVTRGNSHLGHGVRRELIETMWSSNWSPLPVHTPATYDHRFPAAARELIIHSLRFNSIKGREEAVPQAYADTFEWLFKPESQSGEALSWSSFPAWLEQDTQNIYWITGKPGAGKSTLMKFLTGHGRLGDHLSAWAGSDQLLMASFYSWNAGTQLQKSHEGLLRTLLHQCLEQQPDLTPRVCERRWAYVNMMGLHVLRDLPEWGLHELVECFNTLVSQVRSYKLRLVLFIDGLDEFNGDHTKLVELVKDLSQREGVKMCVSSRPWNVFNDAFSRNPSLMVQDLTRNDMERYVRGHFEPMPAFQEFLSLAPVGATSLLQDIVSRADGVFLWVSVVIRTLAEQLTEGAKLDEVQATLDGLPRDVENLFEAINGHISDKHRTASAQYILLFLATKSMHDGARLSPITLLLADEDEASPLHSDSSDFGGAERPALISAIRRRLSSRTMGLLEISQTGYVDVLHRTVYEWIMRPENQLRICQDATMVFDPHLELLKARTTEPFQFQFEPNPTQPASATLSTVIPHSRKMQWMFWSWLALCLHCATLVDASKTENTPRLIRTLERLQRKTHQFSASESFGWYDRCPFFHDNDFPISDENKFLRLAAQFGVAQFVKAKVDRAILRHQTTLFPLLLRDVVFGGERVLGVIKEGHLAPVVNEVSVDLDGLWCSRRLEMVRYLVRIAPRTRENRHILQHVRMEAQMSAASFEPMWEKRVPHFVAKFYVQDVVALLDEELSLPLWVWRGISERSRRWAGKDDSNRARGESPVSFTVGRSE